MIARMTHFAKFPAWLAFVLFVVSCATIPPGKNYHVNYGEVTLFADSAGHLTDERIASFKLLTGKAPTYWGRYICNDHAEYDMIAEELDVFQRNGIRPILILQPGQSELSGSADDARRAAQCFKVKFDSLKAAAGSDLFAGDLMIFLDVEKGTKLSPIFLESLVSEFQGDGILSGDVRFGLYISGGDDPDVRDLINREIQNHVPISIVWYARWIACGPLPYWQEDNIPELGTMNVTAELWQYAAGCHAYADGSTVPPGFDLNAEKPPVYP